MEMEKSRPVVRSLRLRIVYTKAGAWVEGAGFYENGAPTARTEMRNCLFAPVGGEKM